MVLAALLCLSAVAFAERSGDEKYADLLNLLETKQYSKAREYIDRLENLQQDGAAVTEVEITSENWQEYFVLKEEACWLRNDFGEVAYGVWEQVMCVHDEWADKAVLDTSDVAFECSYDRSDYRCTVDCEAQTLEIGELDYENEENETTTFCIGDRYQADVEWSGGTVNGVELLPENVVYCIQSGLADDYGAGYLTVLTYDDLTITRAAGTLVIAE